MSPFKDPEVERQYRKEYYKKNKEHHALKGKEWRENNKEYIKDIMRRWPEQSYLENLIN